MDEFNGDYVDFEDVKGQLSAWVQKPAVYKWIRKSFQHFLYAFRDEDSQLPVYEQRINDMCTANK